MRTRPRIPSDRDLTPEQRRRELIDLLGSAAARMPNAVAIPHDPPRAKPSESGHARKTRLDVSAEMPLSVSAGSRAASAHFVHALRHWLAVVENDPELKAGEHFLRLQRELINTKDRIQAARRFYNGNVRDLNNRVEMFPSSLVASTFGFQKAEFFQVESCDIRQAPQVSIAP